MARRASLGLKSRPAAARALLNGKSLLPAGVKTVDGDFVSGDTVAVKNLGGAVLGHGLVAYDSAEAQRICGKKSDAIEAVLGYPGPAEIIHRDNLVLTKG